MGLILPLVFLGLMASLSPATIVVFVLVLGTARARVNAVGFLFGWGFSLTLVFAGSYALADSGASQTDERAYVGGGPADPAGRRAARGRRSGVAARGDRARSTVPSTLGGRPDPGPHARA